MKLLVKIAVAGAFLASGATAYADVAQTSADNGELVLFVRDMSNENRVYARGLGINLDQLLTAAQITGDPTKPDNTGDTPNFADTDTLNYTFAPIGPDANLTAFLGSTTNYVWTIMAGDNQGGINTEGTRRYLTTAQVDYSTIASSMPNSEIGNSGQYNNLEQMLVALNGVLPGAVGTGDSTTAAIDGLWGNPAGSYSGATNWFGAGPVNDNAIGSAAHLYLMANSTGGALQLARVYKGIDVMLSTDGTLSSVAAGPGGPQVPLPAAVWLLGSALVGLTGISRRRRQAEAA